MNMTYGVMKKETSMIQRGENHVYRAGSIWKLHNSSNLEVMAEEVGDGNRLFFHRQQIESVFVTTNNLNEALHESERIEGQYYLLAE